MTARCWRDLLLTHLTGKESFDRVPGLCCFKKPCLQNCLTNTDMYPGDARVGGMMVFGSLMANGPL